MNILHATNQTTWDTFLSTQQFRPFLQSWTMGEVYRDCGEEPIRMEIRDGNTLVGICQAIVVNARRGKHLAIPYGPITNHQSPITNHLIPALKEEARRQQCSFIRMSPFWTAGHDPISGSKPSPLHLLAEHIWYLPLKENDPWKNQGSELTNERMNELTILAGMRSNTRNLIRRAEKEGVTIEASRDPFADLPAFIALHDETRKRHGFTPYSNDFFRAQVKHFSARKECTLYKALYNGEVISASIHMHAFGETSYHHGASTHAFSKIPSSYLLQWTAIKDALQRGDHVYNFWGIAPLQKNESKNESPTRQAQGKPITNHPFAGVTTFKTGFGGTLLELTHCMDVPVDARYVLTRAFETYRKWRRGF